MASFRSQTSYPSGGQPPCRGTPRREIFDAAWLASVDQSKTVIGKWLKQCNHIRPHRALFMRPPRFHVRLAQQISSDVVQHGVAAHTYQKHSKRWPSYLGAGQVHASDWQVSEVLAAAYFEIVT
jgi:hypothetical protein